MRHGLHGFSRRETDGEFHSGILRMNFPVASADDEFGFNPCLPSKPFRQIFRAHHTEQSDQWRVAFAEHNGATAHDDEVGGFGSGLHAGELGGFVRKHAGEESAGRKMFESRKSPARIS